MNIVRAATEHIDSIAPLFDQYRQFYEQDADLEACRDYIRQRLENNESVIFLALSGTGQGLGFTQLYRSFCSVAMREIIYLYDLYVAPQARRTGTGRALMDRAREYAWQQGAERLTLETHVSNSQAQALYESLGWKKDDEFLTYHLACQ